ncbi:MAG: hypothetical protein A2008_10625 [Candidatus Wallbacteria bacterium GWC2_49_35]|uniref:Uncharacterized protein n=1 Tax=Candidatus Wallbacteria bacterium GWC2_49_35 TaxID=1817813 RepID=A0A1F7X256_9BACT|nr:MAG: hypothetical protein A2008_10625 [Candidatus Wallbacteria bacterium GWC2_49_35]HBC76775.1 hypothetical protein [Candidatus Wallbacteria bacterium]
MQTGSVTPTANFSVNILDIQNGKTPSAEDVNQNQRQQQQQVPASVQNEQQQKSAPAGVGQNIDIKA